jgi:DNA replicative helicase MCM subunit Mcm2 (Cdc46/Mcm family)
MVGDTGTGKTTISQGLFEFARIGDRVSGLTASRTGIVYGMDHDERKGWRVKAGALLKMSRQALIIDEAQDIPVDQIKTSAEGLDTGIIKINRIQHRTFESTTRTIFSCNPKDPKNSADQRGMSTFDHARRSWIFFPRCCCAELIFSYSPAPATSRTRKKFSTLPRT